MVIPAWAKVIPGGKVAVTGGAGLMVPFGPETKVTVSGVARAQTQVLDAPLVPVMSTGEVYKILPVGT